MADFIFMRKSRNALSSALHTILNILLGAGTIFITLISGSPTLGILLVLISKWRIFAVRPRFWLTNLKSNLVDLIIGISIVLSAYYAGSVLSIAHIIYAVIYIAWLLFIKPLSSETGILIQVLLAIFLGTNITSILAARFDSSFIVLLAFFIGYSTSRHILVQKHRENSLLTTLTTALIFAEIAWLCHAWFILYRFNLFGIDISQTAIILTIVAFFMNRIQFSLEKHDGKIKSAEVLAPALFSILAILIIILFFSEPRFNLHV